MKIAPAASETQQYKALQRLSNDPLLGRLETIANQFNLFKALGIPRSELIHSNFLAWLLDPTESHGLKDKFLVSFLNEVSEQTGSQTFVAADVRREWNKIDILIDDEDQKLVCVIENKIMASEQEGQLQRYREIVQKEFPKPEYRQVFVYLTVHGDTPSDKEYVPVSHRRVADLISKLLAAKKKEIVPEVYTFISQYEELLRRHILKEAEVQKLCRKMISEHKEALDMLVDYRHEMILHVHNFLINMIRADDDLILDEPRVRQRETIIRFIPVELDKVFYKVGKGWTKSKRILLFQLGNYEEGIDLALTIGPGAHQTREKIHDKAKKNKTIFANCEEELKTDDSFNTPYYIEWFKPGSYLKMDIDEAEREIKTRFDDFKKGDMQKIINALKQV